MEKDSESWLHHRPLDEQFSDAEFSKLPLNDSGMQNSRFACAIPCTGLLSTFGHLTHPNIGPGELKEPHGWFYGGPGSGQGLVPNITFHDNFMSETNLPAKNAGSGPASKQFLVFDQTGNKTTMMFSSGIGTSIPQATAWTSKPSFYNFNEDEQYYSGPNLADDLEDSHGSVVGSDIREDSEEINALLYSDEEDDNYSDDGEETSTGHSPSTMTSFEKRNWLEEEDMDEVASSVGPVKKRKFSESDDHEVVSVTHTTSHAKPNGSLEYEEDDAESSCVGTKLMAFDDMGSLSGNKRRKREKIRETVSVLETILPCGKGKDAVMVLDEAINYLRSLKYKAISLGLSGSSERLQ